MPAWSAPLSITLWPPASCAGTAPPEVVGSNLMNRMFECCAVQGCTKAQRLNRMFECCAVQGCTEAQRLNRMFECCAVQECTEAQYALPDSYLLHLLELHFLPDLLIQVIGLRVWMVCR